MSTRLTFAVVCGLLIFVQVGTGCSFYSRKRWLQREWVVIRRSESPGEFWSVIAFQVVLVVLIIAFTLR